MFQLHRCAGLCFFSSIFKFLFIKHREKMLNDSEIAELLSFLTVGTRPDVIDEATGYLLGLSGNR